MTLRLNDKYLGKFITAEELSAVQPAVTNAYHTLTGKSGAGNDYLGWIDLPINYDREETARIAKAAERIINSCDVFIYCYRNRRLLPRSTCGNRILHQRKI